MSLLEYLLSLEDNEQRRIAELTSGFEVVYDADTGLPELSRL